ncbi:MAG: hypothetical protein A2Y10_10805 [Planctomycetes bacterium GWF2_41_51]|nr:MAG: hypothetical protein A2Y10_10805 [Planctomycetes bacterium GWF2_41_51]HBG28465.1 hypothetical protein [Phycisphaerales bacterium]
MENFVLEQVNKKILAGRPAEQKPIGQDMCSWLSRVTKNTRKNSTVLSVLGQIIGEEIMQHCSPESIKAGVLKIKVKPGPYMFHLRNMTGEILRTLQTEYPSSHIREIKLIAK